MSERENVSALMIVGSGGHHQSHHAHMALLDVSLAC